MAMRKEARAEHEEGRERVRQERVMETPILLWMCSKLLRGERLRRNISSMLFPLQLLQTNFVCIVHTLTYSFF